MLFSLILVVGAVSRFIPHPANFAAIGAVGIFAGLYSKSRNQAIFTTLCTRFISDLLIGFFSLPIMISVYASTLAGVWLGRLAKRKKNFISITFATITSSIIFYLITNYAVWYFSPLYQRTFTGLMESYTLALPFFRNSLLGDLFYVSVLIGAYEGYQSIIKIQSIRRINAKSRIA